MRVFLAVICLALSSNAYAIDYKKKNHINLGVDAFYRDYSEDLVRPKKSNESGMLYGIVLGYEHKAPESVLFTVDFDLALGRTDYDGALQNLSGDYMGPYQTTTANAFFNFDTQIGYTFAENRRHMFTPFVGVGLSSWGRGIEGSNEIYAWDYVSGGLQYDYNANRQWQYGLHVKLMHMQHGLMEIDEPDFNGTVTLGNKMHYEISAPIIYKYNPDSNNYLRFTPYYLNQSFGESNWIRYTYFSSVQEPASQTHVVGLRAEYAFGF